MGAGDPYDIDQVIKACAAHAWENPKRAQELKDHGFQSQGDIEQHIRRTVEDEKTHAFSSQPQVNYQQSFQREIYNSPFDSPKSGKAYETTIILDPNIRENGQIVGGSLWIRDAETAELQRLARHEKKELGAEPQIVEGGRPALREQQQHQQLAKLNPPPSQPAEPAKKSHWFEDNAPAAPEHTIKR